MRTPTTWQDTSSARIGRKSATSTWIFRSDFRNRSTRPTGHTPINSARRSTNWACSARSAREYANWRLPPEQQMPVNQTTDQTSLIANSTLQPDSPKQARVSHPRLPEQPHLPDQQPEARMHHLEHETEPVVGAFGVGDG